MSEMDILQIKQRFGIIGNSTSLNRAIDVAKQVAPTDLSVLITGESGTGKEVFPQIIHHFSSRKHNSYIAVNCGAIPEGTIDSELFGHEKGSFTGAHEQRKGYFEVADNGTIFLDEVGELPLSTQVRLLRVLEAGEFMKVGSSKVQKTNVRIVAATNVNVERAIEEGKFRQDLYYRLNSVPIIIEPLRKRREDVYLLFRKFAHDFAERNRMPAIKLTDDAKLLLEQYSWPGNIRQLKNIAEQISVIEQERVIDGERIKKYLPVFNQTKLPALYKGIDEKTFSSEREILYKVLFDMKKDVHDLKKLVNDIINSNHEKINFSDENSHSFKKFYEEPIDETEVNDENYFEIKQPHFDSNIEDTNVVLEESLSIENKEIELIKKALEKHAGKRKHAAEELGISERTLYRKIKEYNVE